MKAIVMFDRDKLKWHLVQLNPHGSFKRTLDSMKKSMTPYGREIYPAILEVEVDSFEVTGEKSYLWSSNELPKMPTLEEYIAENRANIVKCLTALGVPTT